MIFGITVRVNHPHIFGAAAFTAIANLKPPITFQAGNDAANCRRANHTEFFFAVDDQQIFYQITLPLSYLTLPKLSKTLREEINNWP